MSWADVALGRVRSRVAREVVAEAEPGELARGPDVRRGDDRVRLVHATDGDVDRARPRRLTEGERRATGGAELAHGARRRAELRRRPGGEDEGGGGERRPGDERRARRAAADAAVAVAHVARRGAHPVADRAAEAAARDLRGWRRGAWLVHRLEGAHPVGARERPEALAGVEAGGALVVGLDLQVDDNRSRLGRDAERRAEETRADATSPRRGLDVELLEPCRPIGVLERPRERERRHAHGPALPDRYQDPPALGMTEQSLDGTRDLRLRGLHAVLAELGDQERRHRFELGLGGETHVYGAPGHRLLRCRLPAVGVNVYMVAVGRRTSDEKAPAVAIPPVPAFLP